MNDDEYTNDTPPQGSARAAILVLLGVLGFFTFLATAIPIVRSRGGDINTFFFVVLGAIASAILVPVLLNLILKKLHLKGKSRRELLHSFTGYTPLYPRDGTESMMVDSTVYEAETPSTRALVPSAATPPALYKGWDNEQQWDEADDLNLGDDEDADTIPVLIERDGLPLTETFQPARRSLECQNITFVGERRFGKSNAIAIFLKQLAAQDFPITVFDSEDEYEELARSKHFPRGLLVGDESFRPDVPEGIRFRSIDTATAYTFGQQVLQGVKQVVVNLKSWDDDTAAEIMSEMILGMEDWQQQHTIQQRIPFYVVVGEVTKWVPQNQGESVLSKDATKMIQHALFDVTVRRGGKRGFGLIVDAQKLSDVDKRILQGIWKVIFCQVQKNDLKSCEASPLNLDPGEVQSLQVGESFVFCPQVPRGMYVRWPLSDVELGGKSPTYENLQAHLRRIHTQGTASRDEPLIARRSRYPATQPAAAPAYSPEVRRGHAGRTASELRAALDAYRPGMTYHDLGRAMSYSDEHARIVWRELRQRGLLHTTPSETEQDTARPEVPPKPQTPPDESELERALRAYDQGHTTVNALALALGMTPWTVRPIYTQVKRSRENAG